MKKELNPLGKLHKWWLNNFKDSPNGLGVMGYQGSPHAKALVGLYDRGLIEHTIGFEGGLDLLRLTDSGRKHLEENP